MATDAGSGVRAPAESGLTQSQLAGVIHHDAVTLEARTVHHRVQAAARRRHRAAVARAKQQAAAAPTATPTAAPTAPTASPTQSPAPVSGGDAAHTALGDCIRNAEEGGSYAWGPGNGGGAYQFAIGTWEAYGGAASEFGAAGAAYQDQIFDNAIAAGGAGNWTNYDGC